ncbi:MAG: enoyl-CoA hydratase [Rhizobacter sp.]|nr:enoyl-CoA hydratase [Rhizobacter sp.]
MSHSTGSTDVGISVREHVGIVEMRKPPHNFFDLALLIELATAFEALDADPDVRALVLCTQGTAFCAGADLTNSEDLPKARSPHAANPIYAEAVRLFSIGKPVVAAVHGAAIGGGLGLALAADFRVSCREARFSANFNRLGITPGFGLTTTLPRLIGTQKAALLFYTGRRIGGEEAFAIGLVDTLVAQAAVRDEAFKLAAEMAASAPLALRATRRALRSGLADAVRQSVARESSEQYWQFDTADFKEGVAAMTERRLPLFTGA